MAVLPSPEAQARNRKLARDKYRKRRRTCIKKAHELAIRCSADVYLAVCKGGKFFIYKSTDRQGWPPAHNDLVGDRHQSVEPELTHAKVSHHYPIPQVFTCSTSGELAVGVNDGESDSGVEQ